MMVDEDTNEESAPVEKKSGVKKLIIINAVVLLVLIIVVVAVLLFRGGKETKDTEVLPEEAVQATEEVVHDAGEAKTPIYVPLNPPFVVNLENQEQVSFLQVEMEVMTYDPEVEKAMKTHAARIRGELLLLLGSKQYNEISNVEGKRKLSQEAIAEIQKILDETGTPGTIEALYFTSFVMQ